MNFHSIRPPGPENATAESEDTCHLRLRHHARPAGARRTTARQFGRRTHEGGQGNKLKGGRVLMRVVVDLNRCQGYAQCVFLAPDVFELHGEEALLYDLEPGRRRASAGAAGRGGVPGAGDRGGAAGRGGATGRGSGGRDGMSIELAVGAAVEEFRRSGRIVIVGCLARRAPRRRGVARGGLPGTPDHHRGRAVRAVRPPSAVEAGAARVGACRSHRVAAHAGGRRRVAARGGGDRAGSGHPAGAAGRRRAGRVRPPADRHRRTRPPLVQRRGGRAGRGVHHPHPRRRGRAAGRVGGPPRAGAGHRLGVHRLRGGLGLP